MRFWHDSRAMTQAASLLTHHNVIIYRDRRLATRSQRLMRFVGYLWWKRRHQPAGSAWVGPEELARVIDKQHPKQMQRYLDALEGARLPLVEYRSKTRGAWRLAIHPRQVGIDRNEEELLAWLDFDPARMSAMPPARLDGMAASLRRVLITDALFAEQGIEDGAADEALDTYRSLQTAPGATAILKASMAQRLCQVHRQRSDYVGWERELTSLEALLTGTERVGGDFAVRVLLQRMFLRYNQGRADEARHILERIDPDSIQDAFTLGRYHNAMGLAMMRRMKEACDTENCESCPLYVALGHFSQALGHALAVNDHAGLEGICFNTGNALYGCLRHAPQRDDPERLREAAEWIGLCEMICHRFGVGGASQWSRLVLADMALRGDVGFDELNRWVGGLYTAYGSLETLLQQTMGEATDCANRLEQAEACRLLAQLHGMRNDGVRAQWYREEAIAICRELGRTDKITQLLDSSPTSMTKTTKPNGKVSDEQAKNQISGPGAGGGLGAGFDHGAGGRTAG